MGKYIAIRSGATGLLENQVAHLTHLITYQSGVYDPTSHWLVSENNPQNMSVNIATGIGLFKKSAITYDGFSDTVENVIITANNSGNPRIDTVIAYVDLSASPNATASNILKFIVVEGIPASSPVPPDDTAIQAAIGATDPFIRLANIYVADGASSIVNANITDVRTYAYQKWLAGIYDQTLIKPYVKGSYNNVIAQSGSGNITLDCSIANIFEITMTGDITLSLSDISVGQFIQIDLIQDGTGGRTPTWFSTIKWADGITPTMTATANKRDSYVIKCIGSNQYIGYVVSQNL